MVDYRNTSSAQIAQNFSIPLKNDNRTVDLEKFSQLPSQEIKQKFNVVRELLNKEKGSNLPVTTKSGRRMSQFNFRTSELDAIYKSKVGTESPAAILKIAQLPISSSELTKRFGKNVTSQVLNLQAQRFPDAQRRRLKQEALQRQIRNRGQDTLARRIQAQRLAQIVQQQKDLRDANFRGKVKAFTSTQVSKASQDTFSKAQSRLSNQEVKLSQLGIKTKPNKKLYENYATKISREEAQILKNTPNPQVANKLIQDYKKSLVEEQRKDLQEFLQASLNKGVIPQVSKIENGKVVRDIEKENKLINSLNSAVQKQYEINSDNILQNKIAIDQFKTELTKTLQKAKTGDLISTKKLIVAGVTTPFNVLYDIVDLGVKAVGGFSKVTVPSFYRYGQDLVKRGINENSSIVKPLVSDFKNAIFKGSKLAGDVLSIPFKAAEYASKNPYNAALISAIYSTKIATKGLSAFNKNPEKALTEIAFLLSPERYLRAQVSIIKKGASVTKKLKSANAKRIEQLEKEIKRIESLKVKSTDRNSKLAAKLRTLKEELSILTIDLDKLDAKINNYAKFTKTKKAKINVNEEISKPLLNLEKTSNQIEKEFKKFVNRISTSKQSQLNKFESERIAQANKNKRLNDLLEKNSKIANKLKDNIEGKIRIKESHRKALVSSFNKNIKEIKSLESPKSKISKTVKQQYNSIVKSFDIGGGKFVNVVTTELKAKLGRKPSLTNRESIIRKQSKKLKQLNEQRSKNFELLSKKYNTLNDLKGVLKNQEKLVNKRKSQYNLLRSKKTKTPEDKLLIKELQKDIKTYTRSVKNLKTEINRLLKKDVVQSEKIQQKLKTSFDKIKKSRTSLESNRLSKSDLENILSSSGKSNLINQRVKNVETYLATIKREIQSIKSSIKFLDKEEQVFRVNQLGKLINEEKSLTNLIKELKALKSKGPSKVLSKSQARILLKENAIKGPVKVKRVGNTIIIISKKLIDTSKPEIFGIAKITGKNELTIPTSFGDIIIEYNPRTSFVTSKKGGRQRPILNFKFVKKQRLDKVQIVYVDKQTRKIINGVRNNRYFKSANKVLDRAYSQTAKIEKLYKQRTLKKSKVSDKAITETKKALEFNKARIKLLEENILKLFALITTQQIDLRTQTKARVPVLSDVQIQTQIQKQQNKINNELKLINSVTVQALRLPSSSIPKTVPSIKPKLKPKPKPEIRIKAPTPPIPKPKVPEVLRKQRLKDKVKILNKPGKRFSYQARIKSGNKIVNVGKPLPINRALYIGALACDKSRAASFEIKLVGRTDRADINRPKRLLNKFTMKRGRDPLVRIFVEKAKYRLDSPSERKDIKKGNKSNPLKKKVKSIIRKKKRKPLKKPSRNKKSSKIKSKEGKK